MRSANKNIRGHIKMWIKKSIKEQKKHLKKKNYFDQRYQKNLVFKYVSIPLNRISLLEKKKKSNLKQK